MLAQLSRLRDSTLRRFGYVPGVELRAAQETASSLALAVNTALKQRSVASGVDINQGRYDYELNQKLKGGLRWDALETMQTDPVVKGALRFQMNPLLGASWDIVAASDKARDKEIAEFCKANYLCESSERYGREFWCSTSWRQRVFEKLDMLPSGFSMAHKSVKRVGGKIVFDRLKWLEPSSVDPQGWILDDADNIVGVHRTYRLPSGIAKFRETVPASVISMDVYELKGARYEGTPFLRSMWGPYYRKDLFQRWALSWAQKVGAGAPIGWYPPGMSVEAIAKFIELVEQQRGIAPTESYGVFPMGADGKPGEVKFISQDIGEGGVDRMRGMIHGENDEMGQGGGNTAMQATQQPHGSRAMVQTTSKVEIMMLKGTASAICETANQGIANLPGDIPLLVDMNFADVREYPRLVCGRVHPDEGLENAPGIIAGVSARLIPLVPELRRQFTELYGLRLPDEAYELEPEPDVDPDDDPDPDDETDERTDDEREDDAAGKVAASAVDVRSRIAPLLEPNDPSRPPGKMRRGPNKLEAKYVNVAAVSQSFERGESEALRVIRAGRSAMILDIARRIVAGKITPRDIESQGRSRPRGQSGLVERLRLALEAVAAEGQGQVRDELGRMR